MVSTFQAACSLDPFAPVRLVAGPFHRGGVRIPVSIVVDMVASGLATEEILDLYPDLEREDIMEALPFAAKALRSQDVL